MLLNIIIKNFRSYNEAQTLSLLASNTDLVNPEVNSVKIGESYIRKSAIIYGANASGKSNIIKAIITLINIVDNGLISHNQIYHPFFNNKHPTTITIDFSIDNNIYTYLLSYDNNKIYVEKLLNYNNSIIFARKLKENNYEYEIPDPELILSNEQQKSGLLEHIKLSTSEKVTFLNQAVITFNSKKLEPILSTIKKWVIKLNHSAYGERFNSLNAASYFKSTNKKEHLIRSLNSIGANLQDVRRYRTSTTLTSIYNIDGSEYKLDFLEDESDGTIKFYSYLALIDLIIQNDGVLIIDDLETNLHPILVEEIIRAIHYSNSKAQLIFTTHNPILLNELIFERDQIYFTEKNDSHATEIFSLVDFSDLEKTPQNLTAKYMCGKLGAIPHIKWDFLY